MKKLSITLTIICFAFGVKAQTFEKMPDTKPGTISSYDWKNLPDSIKAKTSGVLTNIITFPDYNALDTIKCWFKEVKEVILNKGTLLRPDKKDSILYAGDTVIYEKWYRGYMIVSKYGWVSKIQGKLRHANIENYLYSDRKTVVKNRVLEHIEL